MLFILSSNCTCEAGGANLIYLMKNKIASVLNCDIDIINIKATTEEKLGFTGSGEGISAQAICLLETVANYAYDDTMMQERSCISCPGCAKQEEV